MATEIAAVIKDKSKWGEKVTKRVLFDVARGILLGLLMSVVLLKLLGADTSVLQFRYAGY